MTRAGWVVVVALSALGCETPGSSDDGGTSGTDGATARHDGFVPRRDAGPPPPPPPPTCEVPVTLVDTSSPDHVVGDGTAASCTQAAFGMALAMGGVITFDCGPDPISIAFTEAKEVVADTVIDGGGLVTFAGDGSDRLLEMDTGNYEATSPHLTVQRLTFTGGRASGELLDGGGGAIFYRGGRVTVIDSTFVGNEAELAGPDVAGGAIYGIGLGETVVVGSTFRENRASNGGAIGALGSALTIVNSTLHANTATGFGANYVEGGVQMGMGGNGGAVSMDGQGRTLSICGSTFTDNEGGAFGGAVFRTGYESEPNPIHLSTFDGNSVRDPADPDEPSGAGALYLQGVNVTLTRSTISHNRARSSAGVWILGHGGAAPGVANLENVTITGNSTYEREDFTTRGVAAGLTIGNDTTGLVRNCTITGNAAQFGSATWGAGALTFRNTIFANEAENLWVPLNCGPGGQTASGENNVQWPNGMSAEADSDCTPGIARLDPMMGALGDHGGPTRTVLPMASGLPEGTDCPSVDQRGEPRDSGRCTIGAVELD